MSIALVDTSIFCNILDVPQKNQDRAIVFTQLEEYIRGGMTLLLPVATILETGKHIAHLRDGRLRRALAKRFVKIVRQALAGLDNNAPWIVPQPLLDPAALCEYLDEFPDYAMRGISLADLSIIKEYERQRKLFSGHRVFIWSLDEHLQAYDYAPQI